MRTILAAVAAAAVLTGMAFGKAKEDAPFVPPATLDELDVRIADAVKASKVVGLQVALVDSTGVVWARSYGHLDTEKTRPVENDSVFRAGSISKSFTGLLAEMLVEEGAIDWNAKLSDVLPEVHFVNKWEATDPVRLVHLAEHTTGWDDIQFSEYRSFAPDISILDGLNVNTKARTARWRPGRYASYNNAGPSVLAGVMEKATGRRYEDLVDERIFKPLGVMNASFFLTDGVAAKLSKSYAANLVEEPYTHIAMRPAGSLNISASELGKLVAFYIRRGDAGGVQLLTPETVDRIGTSTTSLGARAGLKLGYGLGVYGSNIENRVFYGHTGGIDGFISQYGYSKELGAGFIGMSNTADGAGLSTVRKLLVAYLLAKAPPVEIPPPAEDDLARYEGWYQQLTPNLEFTRLPGDAADVLHVTKSEGGLLLKPLMGDATKVVALGNGLFRHEKRNQADRVFLTTPEGALELHDFFQSAYRRVPVWQALLAPGVIAATALAAAMSALSLVIWILARPFGAFKKSNRWRVWAMPTIGLASVVAALFVLAYCTSTFAGMASMLGAPTPWSYAVKIATFFIPAAGVCGLFAVFLAPGVNAFSRAHAGFAALTLTALGALLWKYHLIGLTLWSYQPAIVGQ